ncbi:hypothetical protein V1478_015639 [Vespula squamosa]|uniref:Uncharacterized protein n=1 Tax=Vespula squamosa TaxID=30214 RepID=A0ABD2A1F1_VESSQ
MEGASGDEEETTSKVHEFSYQISLRPQINYMKLEAKLRCNLHGSDISRSGRRPIRSNTRTTARVDETVLLTGLVGNRGGELECGMGWDDPRDSFEGDVGSVDDDDDDDDGGIGPPAEHSESLYRLRCLSCGLPVTASQTDSARANLAFKKGN